MQSIWGTMPATLRPTVIQHADYELTGDGIGSPAHQADTAVIKYGTLEITNRHGTVVYGPGAWRSVRATPGYEPTED